MDSTDFDVTEFLSEKDLRTSTSTKNMFFVIAFLASVTTIVATSFSFQWNKSFDSSFKISSTDNFITYYSYIIMAFNALLLILSTYVLFFYKRFWYTKKVDIKSNKRGFDIEDRSPFTLYRTANKIQDKVYKSEFNSSRDYEFAKKLIEKEREEINVLKDQLNEY